MDPLSAGIGAAGSLLGGFFTHNYNRWMLRQQMKYNTSEREASQDWQNQQRVAQNQFSEDMYNKYSSPQALVAQYQAAGLNPRLAVEGGQVGSVQASSGSSGSAPKGAMLSMPYMQSPDFTQGFVNMANVLKSIAEAKKAGVQTDYLEETAKDNARLVKVQADAAEFQQMLNIKYSDAERLAALLNTKSQTNVNDKNAKVLEKDYDILCEKLHIAKFDRDHLWDRYFWEEQRNTVEVGQGQANVSNTNADTLFKQAQTITEKTKPAMNMAITKLTGYQAEAQRIAKEIAEATNLSEVYAIRAKNGKTLEYIEAEIKNLNAMAEEASRSKNYELYEAINHTLGALGLGGFMYALGKKAFRKAAPFLALPVPEGFFTRDYGNVQFGNFDPNEVY